MNNPKLASCVIKNDERVLTSKEAFDVANASRIMEHAEREDKKIRANEKKQVKILTADRAHEARDARFKIGSQQVFTKQNKQRQHGAQSIVYLPDYEDCKCPIGESVAIMIVGSLVYSKADGNDAVIFDHEYSLLLVQILQNLQCSDGYDIEAYSKGIRASGYTPVAKRINILTGQQLATVFSNTGLLNGYDAIRQMTTDYWYTVHDANGQPLPLDQAVDAVVAFLLHATMRGMGLPVPTEISREWYSGVIRTIIGSNLVALLKSVAISGTPISNNSAGMLREAEMATVCFAPLYSMVKEYDQAEHKSRSAKRVKASLSSNMGKEPIFTGSSSGVFPIVNDTIADSIYKVLHKSPEARLCLANSMMKVTLGIGAPTNAALVALDLCYWGYCANLRMSTQVEEEHPGLILALPGHFRAYRVVDYQLRTTLGDSSYPLAAMFGLTTSRLIKSNFTAKSAAVYKTYCKAMGVSTLKDMESYSPGYTLSAEDERIVINHVMKSGIPQEIDDAKEEDDAMFS